MSQNCVYGQIVTIIIRFLGRKIDLMLFKFLNIFVYFFLMLLCVMSKGETTLNIIANQTKVYLVFMFFWYKFFADSTEGSLSQMALLMIPYGGAIQTLET